MRYEHATQIKFRSEPADGNAARAAIVYSRRAISAGVPAMGQSKPATDPRDRIGVDPGAEKRLLDILKRALNTPSSRHGNEPRREKPAKAK